MVSGHNFGWINGIYPGLEVGLAMALYVNGLQMSGTTISDRPASASHVGTLFLDVQLGNIDRWDGSAWKRVYTPFTATDTAVATTGATNVLPYGFAEAQANDLVTRVNALLAWAAQFD